jgi:hypothetical protein
MISIEGLLEDEQGLSMGEMLTVKIRQPSHEFTFGVGIGFIPYPFVGVLDRQPTTGSTRSRWSWLAEIDNSKEETRGTQFRQVRAARCVIPYVLYAV